MIRYTFAFILLLCAGLWNTVSAQRTPDTLGITGHSYWGFDLGLTGSAYEGASNFFWHLSDPLYGIETYTSFDNLGSGTGFVGGIKAGFPLSNSINLEGKLRYLTNYTSATETHTNFFSETSNPASQTTATNSYNLKLSNVSLSALGDFRFSDQFYGIGGLEFSELLSNSIEIHQALDPSGPGYYSHFTSQEVLGAYSVDHPASSEDSYFNKSRLALQLGVGSGFHLSPSTLLDLELLLSIPFSEWLTSSAESHLDSFATTQGLPAVSYPKLWYASLTVGIRFPFGGSNAEPVSTEAERESNGGAASTTNGTIGSDGKVALTGRVTNSKGDPVDATMTVVDLTNNNVVATDHTDRNGNYSVRVLAPGKYSVTADADGYLFGTAYFEVDPQGRILARHPDIKLSEATTGKTRLLVFFDFGKTELQRSSYPELERAVRLMKAVPTMQVEIVGYTDNVGNADYNKSLSQKRANAVRDYLTQHGIAKSRVTARGMGMESPIADNSTEEGRAENRRVEFVVVSK